MVNPHFKFHSRVAVEFQLKLYFAQVRYTNLKAQFREVEEKIVSQMLHFSDSLRKLKQNPKSSGISSAV